MAENTGVLQDPTGTILDQLRRDALAHGLPIDDQQDRIAVSTAYGRIAARREGGCLQLSLTAARSGDLTVLRDTVYRHLGAEVEIDWTGVQRGRPENLHVLEVAAVTEVSPCFLRLHLRGETGALQTGGYHVRLISPTPEWPQVGADGRMTWPEAMPLPHRPVYTIFECTEEMVSIDVFRHSDGRAVRWVEGLRPGDLVGAMGPGGSGLPGAQKLSLWGDETALPAILRILREAPAGCSGSATLLVPSAADVRPLKHDRFHVTWLLRQDQASLTQALATSRPEDEDTFLWFAADQVSARAARASAAQHGVDSARTYISAFWKLDQSE